MGVCFYFYDYIIYSWDMGIYSLSGMKNIIVITFYYYTTYDFM